MPAENLTRLEASQRASIIAVENYLIELDLTLGDKVFGSKTTVKFSCNEPGSSSFIDAITDDVSLIELNGKPLDPSQFSDGVRITIPDLEPNNILVIDATARYTNTGEGLHRFVDPADNEIYLYTQFEVPDSRRVFAVFEQPDLKASFSFSVTGPKHWQLVSNSPTPEPIVLNDSYARWEFAPTQRISSYITALIAGPYVSWHDSLVSSSGLTIPLGVFCRKSLAEFMDSDYIFETTKAGFDFYEKTFDYPYPFPKYDQLWVPEFNAGAMENAGAVTFTEAYVFRSKVTEATRERRVVTILHELAHMWFGDLVTMRWWNDLWLNESFAEYASTLATAETSEWKSAWTTFASLEKNWAYRQDQLPSTHPIVAEIRDLEDVQVNFDGITYAKGASVLKQLVAWVGRDEFELGIANYFKKHAYGNTVLSDLLTELEQTSGRDLSSWSQQWLETAGVNTLRAKFQTEGDIFTEFQITQTALSDYPTIRPHRLGIGFYDKTDAGVVRSNYLEVDVAGEITDISDLVGLDKPDLILVNDEDLAYAKIRLDDTSMAFAIDNLSDVQDSLARALIWTAAWDATRDGETKTSNFIELILKNIAAETESTTVLTLLRQLSTAAMLYTNKSSRDETISTVATRLIELATLAAPGSDSQFQFARAVAGFARTQPQLLWTRQLLEGDQKLSGLAMDADLRWELITGLVAAGIYSEKEITAELGSDNTASGQKAAAAALAAIPNAESKLETWQKLMTDESLSNALINSSSLGLVRVIDNALLEPFQNLYLETALEIWNGKSYQIADYLLTNLFPIQLASQELAQATKAKLDSAEIVAKPALRRILVENLANLERALVAQEKDGEK